VGYTVIHSLVHALDIKAAVILLLFCYCYFLSMLLPLLAPDLTTGSGTGFQFRLQLGSHSAPVSREDICKGLVNSQSRKVLGDKSKAESYLFF